MPLLPLLHRRELLQAALAFGLLPRLVWAAEGEQGPRPHVLDTWTPGPAEGTQVDKHGATGDGETDDTDAIDKAIARAGKGGTVVFTGGRTYIVGRYLSAMAGQTWTSSAGFATLKLGPYSRSTLTFPVAKGDKRVFVADPTAFRVGQAISSFDGKKGVNRRIRILRVDRGSKVLELDRAFPRGFDAGSELFTPSVLVSTPAHADGMTLRGLRFDGSRGARDRYNQWEICRVVNRRGPARIERCAFVEVPGDAISGGTKGVGLVVEDCTFTDLGGSAIHLSADTDAILRRCRIVRSSLKHRQMMHAEGAITWSAHNPNTVVEAIDFVDCAAAAFGAVGIPLNNVGIRIRDCFGQGLGSVLDVRASRAKANVDADLHMERCRFESCGPVQIRHGGGFVVQGITLSDCTFVDTPLDFRHVDITVKNCSLVGRALAGDALFLVKGVARLDLEGSTKQVGDGEPVALKHPLLE